MRAAQVGDLAAALRVGPLHVLQTFSTVLWHAVVAWCLLALPLALAVYAVAAPMLRKRRTQ